MSKVLNQQLYSRTVYGSENANGNLRLEATSSANKGAVQVVSAALDLIIASFTARVSHSNTANRDYTLPDASGEILVSGRFQSTGDIFYGGLVPGTAEVLYGQPGGALTTDLAGVPQWSSGLPGQVLTISSTYAPVFADVPDDPSIAPGALNSLPVYTGQNNNLAPLSAVSGRVLLTPSGVPTWSLLTASYLRANTDTALDQGTSGYLLTAAGDGGFVWEKPNPSFIHPGPQFAVPFYSNTGLGTVVSASSFFSVNPTQRAIELRNAGKIRFFEASINGSNYLEFRAPASLGPDTVWTLPEQDGAAGAQLQTDGAGNLSFVDNGSVAYAQANQLAYYSVAGNDVVGLTTTPSRVLLSTASSVPSWSLLTASFLSTTSSAALSNGLLNQVLVSNTDGSFSWATATDLTGEVKVGNANYLAFYGTTGRAVQGNSFVQLDTLGRRLVLDAAGVLSFISPDASGSVSFVAPAGMGSRDLSFSLPKQDGDYGHGIITNASGALSFVEVGRGNVLPASTVGGVAIYTTNTSAGHGQVGSLDSVADRVLLTSSSNTVKWALIEPRYLDVASGSLSPASLLGSDASGEFAWVDPVSLTGAVRLGTANFLAYYPNDGREVEASSFIKINDETHALSLLAEGTVKLYDSTDGQFIGFKARTNLTSSTTFTVPPNDGLDGDVLVTDGSGNLSFRSLETDLIGPAEDGSYADGLFTDFTSTTKIGVAVDRFNEVLKALAPPPAGNLSSISFSTAAGATGRLSFGSSNVIASYTNVGSEAGGSALDVNSSYTVGSRIKGIYAPTTVSGLVAGTAPAHAYAYPAAAFGDGNVGILKLEVNGSVVHSVDLSLFPSGGTVNANASGFSLSAATSVQFQDGTRLDLFKYRTGSWVVSVADQRPGWNYVRVLHQLNSFVTRTTNFFEWVNDADTTPVAFSGASLRDLNLTGSRYLSGVRYYTGGSALYDVSFTNAYRNTYSASSTAISHPTTFNCNLASEALPSTDTETKQVQLTGKLVTITPEANNRILGEDVSVSTRVLRTVQNAGTSGLAFGGWKILLDANTPASTALVEDFEGELYRQKSDLDVQSLSYGAGPSSGPANWDSTTPLADGLLIYAGALRYPTRGFSGGDFRNVADGNASGPTVPGGYTGNPNYSGLTGEKVYLRYFNTGNAKQNFLLNVTSTQTNFVAASNRGSLTGNNVTVEILAPNLTRDEAGNVVWKDCVTAYTIDSDVGAYAATYGSSIPTAWGVTLGTKSTANSSFTVLLRITASDGWTGSIDSLSLSPL